MIRRAAAFAASVVLATAVSDAAPAVPASPPAPARALTTADDARACVVLSSGGVVAATGGGLAIVGKDETVRTLTSLDGLPDTRVHTVVEAPDGVWIGTEGGAALVTIGSGGPSIARTVGTTPVHAIHLAGSAIYLGTWGGGVVRLADKAAAPAVVPTSAPGKHVAAIAEHAGVVHVAYADGPVARLEGGTLRALANSPTHGSALLSTGARLVLGDIEGAYRIDGEPSSFASVDARGFAVVGDKLLVATFGSGLLSGSAAASSGLRSEAGLPRWVRGIGVRGTARCAATSEGLFLDGVAGPTGWRKVLFSGPPSNDVTTLAVSGDRVAVGTFDRGAAIHQGGAFRRIAGLEREETVNASAWQGEGAAARLWLGTAHGLVRVDANGVAGRRWRTGDGLPSSIVRAVLVLSPDRLLVGTEEGPAFLDGDRVTPLAAVKKGDRQPIESPMHATWALAASPDGTLYIGTASGLYFGKDGHFERASLATSDLRDDWVTALALKSDGKKPELMVGTYSGGVTHLTFDPRPRAVHLAGGYVNPDGLTIRGGELLAATMDGLLVRPIADDTAKWEARPGASTGRDVTATRVVGGALWVASRRGIAIGR